MDDVFTLTRGERNNNPGNIDYDPAIAWVGQMGIEMIPPGTVLTDPRFAWFDCAENGIRAIARILMTYHRRGFATIRAAVCRWAPPDENDSGAYVAHVARCLDRAADAPWTPDVPTLVALATAIIEHENGRCAYAPAVIAEGVRRALLA